MLDKEFFEFKDTPVTREATYIPQYQITKVANDRYQFYDFANRKAEMCSAKSMLRAVASVRGGRMLDADLTNKLLTMGSYDTVTIPDSALTISKSASADVEHEPWKLVTIGGAEYFVKADDENEEVETVKKTAAALPTKHIYTVNIKAHNVREIAKIASCAEETMCALPGTTQIPNQEQIAFDMQTELPPADAQTSIQKALEHEGIYLPDNQVGVYNDMCPCGCGKEVHEHQHAQHGPHGLKELAVEVPEGQFVLIPLDGLKQSFASSLETLKAYASANYPSYKIYNDKKEVVASMLDNTGDLPSQDRDQATFSEELTNYLMNQHNLNATAAETAKVLDSAGNEKPAGAEIQEGDTVIGKDGVATEVKQVEKAAEEAPELQVKAEDEEPKGDTASDEPQDDVKRWKGMRQDENSGKYIVYVTESREQIFNNPEEAINYMTRN